MIDGNALKFIEQTIVATVTACHLPELSTASRESYSLGGEIVPVEKEHPSRGHTADSLEDFIAATLKHGTPHATVVWYDHESAVAVLNGNDFRDDLITFALDYTDVFMRVSELKSWYEQKPFIRLLRIDLAGTLPALTLLNPVRKVKFENGVIIKGDVSRQKESMSRELKSELTTDGADLPEEVSLTVKLLRNFGEDLESPIRCSVEVDPAAGAFRLLPLPDEIEKVKNWVLADIGERLRAGLGEIPCFLGSP